MIIFIDRHTLCACVCVCSCSHNYMNAWLNCIRCLCIRIDRVKRVHRHTNTKHFQHLCALCTHFDIIYTWTLSPHVGHFGYSVGERRIKKKNTYNNRALNVRYENSNATLFSPFHFYLLIFLCVLVELLFCFQWALCTHAILFHSIFFVLMKAT